MLIFVVLVVELREFILESILSYNNIMNKYEIGWNGLSFKIPENLLLTGNLIINDKEIINSKGEFTNNKHTMVYHFIQKNNNLANQNGNINYESLNNNVNKSYDSHQDTPNIFYCTTPEKWQNIL